MKNLSAEIKVGIFAVIVIMILSFMTFKIGWLTSGFKKGYTLYVAFDNISGLDEKSKIKIAGVDAGTVEKIRLKNGKAELTLIVDPYVKVYKDAKASLRVSGLLGDKYLALKTGSPSEPLLSDGDRIENVEPAADIDALANELTAAASHISDLASSLASLLDMFGISEKKAISESIFNLRSATADLRDILRDNKEPFKTTLARMEDFSATLKDKSPRFIDDLSAAAKELKGLIEENKPAVKESVENLKTFSQSAGSIAKKIEKGEGTLGKLLKDEKLYDSLSEAAGGISKSFSTVDRLRTYIDFRTEYLSRDGEWKGYFNLTLQPRDDKYYLLGVVTDPAGSGEVTDTIVNGVKTTEEKIKRKVEFTAQFARRFNDFALRVGLTENTFGFGADYFFYDDKARVAFDMWDFSANEAMADRAHMKVGLEYRVFKHIFITSGLDNMLNSNRRGVYVGGGLKFEDEDFKYLFGVVPRLPSN